MQIHWDILPYTLTVHIAMWNTFCKVKYNFLCNKHGDIYNYFDPTLFQPLMDFDRTMDCVFVCNGLCAIGVIKK